MTISTDMRHALDAVAFCREGLGINPDPWQANVLRSSSKRMLLNCSRQAGKSTISAALALHTAIYQPHALILVVSPSLRQSSELFRKIMDHFKRLNSAEAVVEETKLSLTLANASRLVSLPANEGTIRGFSGATLILEDEAARVSDDLYRAMRPMLATTNGRHILLSTPFGKRGHFWEEWQSGATDWERVRITAPQCARISPTFLEEERRSLGERWFAQEYLCHFGETEAQVFGYDLVAQAISSDVKPLFPREQGQSVNTVRLEVA